MSEETKLTKLDRKKIIVMALWSIFVIWFTFFTRLYDGMEYILAMGLTWIAIIVIIDMLGDE